MDSNSPLGLTTRREMLQQAGRLASGAFFAQLFPPSLLRPSAARSAQQALLTQPKNPRQKRVRALDVFDGDDMPVDHDSGLSNVERTERMQHLTSHFDVGKRLQIRHGAGEPGRWRCCGI